MFKIMAMEHINTLLIKLYSYFYRLIWLYGYSIFPSLFIFRQFFSISGKYFKLGSMNVEWMNHSPHFIRLIVNFPYFCFSSFLSVIDSIWIKFLSIYRYFIHHSKEFYFLWNW